MLIVTVIISFFCFFTLTNSCLLSFTCWTNDGQTNVRPIEWWFDLHCYDVTVPGLESFFFEWTNERRNERTKDRRNEQRNERTNERTNNQPTNQRTNERTNECVFFWQQLRVTRNSFNCILNILEHRLVWQSSHLRDPLPPEEILMLGLYHLGHHWNFYVSIGPSFNGIPRSGRTNFENLEIV